jgi:GNAT superfamily N-acetyltransferase
MQSPIVSNLRHVPQFVDAVADRGWRAWWTESGVALATYRTSLEPMLRGDVLPMAFVAHRDESYMGSVLLIESDLEARPQLSPWIAALWVDEQYRGQGIAQSLMTTAQTAAAKLGFSGIFLCAEAKVTPYYLRQGWKQIETNVGGLNVFEMPTI